MAPSQQAHNTNPKICANIAKCFDAIFMSAKLRQNSRRAEARKYLRFIEQMSEANKQNVHGLHLYSGRFHRTSLT